MKKLVTDINNNIYIQESSIKLDKEKRSKNKIELSDEVICPFLGLGGAITESSAYNYSKLDKKNKKNLINSYFSKSGLNYNFGRISIGSCDFSLKTCELSKKRDLSDFNLNYDKKYILPMLKDIYKERKLDLIATPWAPPKMYRSFSFFRNGGKLKKKYYSSYAKYINKFINEYKDMGFNIKYITMQNEPLVRQRWESCVFNIKEQKDFIYNYLDKELNNVSILLHDHNKDNMFNIFNNLYKESTNVKGIAFHWYNQGYFDEINKIRKNNKDVLIINSETCCGFSPYREKEWINDAKLYLIDMINDFNNGCNAYIDWNILLDINGGPNHKKNYCKSPIILSNDNKIIKTPIYYYLYHISKLNGNITYNSINNDNLLVVSSLNRKNRVVVILNPTNDDYDFNISINNKYINDTIKQNSIITYII